RYSATRNSWKERCAKYNESPYLRSKKHAETRSRRTPSCVSPTLGVGNNETGISEACTARCARFDVHNQYARRAAKARRAALSNRRRAIFSCSRSITKSIKVL